MRTELPLGRALAAAALVAALGLIATSARAGGEGALELAFRADAGGGGLFSLQGRIDAPRGTLVVVGLVFDGEAVPGTVRRLEVGAEGVVRALWPARARVLAGEYEALAVIDSSRQPRSIRGALPGPIRRYGTMAYVGDPDACVTEEEAVRRTLIADAAAIASVARQLADASPLTTASDASARAARRQLL